MGVGSWGSSYSASMGIPPITFYMLTIKFIIYFSKNKLWCWRRLLRVSWTSKRSNLSLPRKINIHRKNWCWIWCSKSLTTWFKEPTYWKKLSCYERLKAGGERGVTGWDGHEFGQTQGDSEEQGNLAATVHGVTELDLSQQLNSNSNHNNKKKNKENLAPEKEDITWFTFSNQNIIFLKKERNWKHLVKQIKTE